MARNIITSQRIKDINELYIIHQNYSEVARLTNLSPSTIKKYVLPHYIPAAELITSEIDLGEARVQVENYLFQDFNNPDILQLTQEEQDAMPAFWEELSL